MAIETAADTCHIYAIEFKADCCQAKGKNVMIRVEVLIHDMMYNIY